MLNSPIVSGITAVTVLALLCLTGGAGSTKAGHTIIPEASIQEGTPPGKATVKAAWSEAARLHYLLTLPANLPETTTEAGGLPLIVFLHSLQERGGPLELLIDNPAGQGQGLAGYALEQQEFPFATLSPLCPRHSYWTFMHRRMARLIEDVVSSHRIDPQQVFLCGVSMGGIGTWSLGMAHPGLFKALAPIAGGVYSPPIRPRYSRLNNLPVWAFHDRGDPSIPYKLADDSIRALRAAGGNGRMSTFDTGRHYVQDQVFADGKLFKWFMNIAAGND